MINKTELKYKNNFTAQLPACNKLLYRWFKTKGQQIKNDVNQKSEIKFSIFTKTKRGNQLRGAKAFSTEMELYSGTIVNGLSDHLYEEAVTNCAERIWKLMLKTNADLRGP